MTAAITGAPDKRVRNAAMMLQPPLQARERLQKMSISALASAASVAFASVA